LRDNGKEIPRLLSYFKRIPAVCSAAVGMMGRRRCECMGMNRMMGLAGLII